MISTKELGDGLVETIVDLPIKFLRTNMAMISGDLRAPFVLARRRRRNDRRILGLRTTGFLMVAVLYALTRVMDAHTPGDGAGPFAESTVVELFKLRDAKLYEKQFVSLLAFFFGFYYVFYILWPKLSA